MQENTRTILTRTVTAIALAVTIVSGASAETTEQCDGKPVLMVVSGVTLDRQRMAVYAQALQATGLYKKLGAYYLNAPRPVATFEGSVDDNHVSLTVRFPCLANAQRFWHSKAYQDTIRPLRLEPSAGDYTVTVYREIDIPAHLEGKVGNPKYFEEFSGQGIELSN